MKWLKRKGQVVPGQMQCPNCGELMKVSPTGYSLPVIIWWRSEVRGRAEIALDRENFDPDPDSWEADWEFQQVYDEEVLNTEIECRFCLASIDDDDFLVALGADIARQLGNEVDLTQGDIDLGELEVPE